MIRTRFAPSPTGSMHIGNLRTALYAYLLARHSGGRFILRIEDTDRRRHVPEAIQVIYDSLRLAGIDWDEGPDVGGSYGPYVQSERRAVYREHAEHLLEIGAAYRCFCARAEAQAAAAPALRDPCRLLPRAEAEARARAGEPHTIRQRIPEGGVTSFVDHVFGTITVSNDTLDDQVLLKSDGLPTYNLANVIDDHLMAITHVVRGVEYLSSAPKYNLLYTSLGWEIPEYVHLPHIVKESGKKLSKRDGDASFQDILARGYLPEAVVNYIALLGWSPGDDREFFTLAGLVAEFDIDRINKSSAAFSFAKLDWLNGEHIRTLPAERFHAAARGYYPARIAEALDTARLSRLVQPRVARLSDIPHMVAFFGEVPAYDVALYNHDKSRSTVASSRDVLERLGSLLAALEPWSNEALHQRLVAFAAEAGLKTGTVMWPLRIALSGSPATPGGATELAEVLGKDETLRRIAAALEVLRQA
ncbi:MAG TPA: glutamate--tRNA ligase [Anaerolineae bacterium]|nr:glutamate--tRNA ligase [Anaerolineae bacterium]HOQ99137.1 glutamate--tRNA ligase [Anaerolineae bacterium]HPL27278.1 glutamate--tRNA ligase [Anaerolineae bacterium]